MVEQSDPVGTRGGLGIKFSFRAVKPSSADRTNRAARPRVGTKRHRPVPPQGRASEVPTPQSPLLTSCPPSLAGGPQAAAQAGTGTRE